MKWYKTPEIVSILIATLILCGLALLIPTNAKTTDVSTKRGSTIIQLIGGGCVEVVYYEGYVNDDLIVTNLAYAQKVECPK